MQYDEIHRLKTDGMGIRAISRQLRISRDKVRRYLQNDQPPVYHRRKMKTILDPYRDYLEQRWQAGHRNGIQLWQEIRDMGFPVTYQSMARQIHHLRATMPRQTRHSVKWKPKSSPPIPILQPFSVRQTTWLFVKPLTQLEGDPLRYVTRLLAESEDLPQLHMLVHQF